jgi:hypothetical protein
VESAGVRAAPTLFIYSGLAFGAPAWLGRSSHLGEPALPSPAPMSGGRPPLCLPGVVRAFFPLVAKFSGLHWLVHARGYHRRPA